MLASLGRLVDESVVMAEEHVGEVRYRLLETTRAFAAARLAEAREDAALRDRHLRWHVAFAEEADALREVVLDRWRAALQREYADLRTALEWGLHGGAPDAGRRPAASLAWLWHVDRHGGVEPFGAHRVLPSRWRRTRSRRRTNHRCSATAASST